MKIDQVKISNFKRIKLVEFKPEGELVVIGGKNGQGKTSVLDAIASALSGTKPKISDPVRHGSDKYETTILTDTGLEIRQYGTKDGTYGLRVRGADGMEAAQPAKFLEKFYSTLTFDPLAFARQSAGQQGETLRRLLNLDWSALDDRRKNLYDARTAVNREIGALGEVPEPDAKLPVQLLDVGDLYESLNTAHDANENRRRTEASADHAREILTVWQLKLEEAKREFADSQKQVAACDAAVTLLPEPVDTDRLIETLRNADATNARVTKNNELRVQQRLLEERKANAVTLTEKIADVDATKRSMIAAAEFPVGGLDFAEDGTVLFNEVPFDQAAESEKIRVSASIGLEMAPQLKVLLVRDGSLLDDDSLAELEALARLYDAQILIERVGSEGAQIVMRDGEVEFETPWED